MEERDRHAVLATEARQAALRLGQFPMRGEIAAVLVGIGVADHHFLEAPLYVQTALHEWYREELLQDGRRLAQIGNGFKQRNDRQGTALNGGDVGEEAAFLGHEIDAEHVGGAAGHAENQGTEGLAVDLLAHARNGAKGRQGLRGILRQARVGQRFAARRAKLRQ